jgi:cyclopropane fatty-acyl-phospholipid synthase-like methyltransferase
MSGSETPPHRPHTPEQFDAFYHGTPPWDIGRPQAAFRALAQAGAFRSPVLDVGCGTGEHALLAASLGLDTAGVDTSPTAIARAQAKAGERGLSVDFQVANALALPSLGRQFQTVLDCGLFHVFSDPDRVSFVESLSGVVPSGGRYFMLCFSERQPGDTGPRRVTQQEIRESFRSGWRVDSIEPVTLEVTLGPEGIAAWLASLTRM